MKTFPMKILSLAAFLFFSPTGFSQEKIPDQDGEEILALAGKASGEGNIDLALEILDRMNPKDSIYCSALVSRSYYLLNQNKNKEAIKAADEGLGLDCGESDLFYYINKGVAHLNAEQPTRARLVLEEGIGFYPKNSQLWYNLGVVFENLDLTREAVAAYQNSILYNPSYARPHLRLGDICYKQEMTAQAIMSYNMYLLLDPDGNDSFRVLKGLNELVQIRNENKADRDLEISKDEGSFDELNLILDNKLALNDQYKVNSKINVPLTKQNHLLFEQLQSYKSSEGFWAETYVPLFQWIWENGFFELFTYTVSFSIENEKYKPVITRNIDGVREFIEAASGRWIDILGTSDFRLEPEDQGMAYLYSDYRVSGKGLMKNKSARGKWEFYASEGKISGHGEFDEQGERTGKWIWYYPSGGIKEYAHYQKGLLEGENKAFFRNGQLEYAANYANDELSGEYRLYNKRGALLQKKYFAKGLLDGPYRAYFQVGEVLPEFDVLYSEGLIEDKAFEYYADGSVYAEMNFKKGEQSGPEKIFNKDGSLYSEVLYEAGKATGPYAAYFSSGNPKERAQYENGVFEGPFETYYEDGNLESSGTWSKGALHGVARYFDRDGKLHYEYDYKQGEIIAYRFYDKTGEILDQGNRKGGEFYYKGYSPLGQVTSEGLYDISGGKKEKWKFYSDNGVLTGEGIYVDNKADGSYTEYYGSGEKMAISTFNMDTLDGYFVDYHKNGQMRSQGWYKNGVQHGEWRSYYANGTPESQTFFHKGEFHNLQEFYGVDGKKRSTFMYEYGDPVSEILFDPEQKIVQRIEYINSRAGEYLLEHLHLNGNTDTRATFVNGLKHGAYTQFDPEGRKIAEGNFLNGAEHGNWVFYHQNGEVKRRLTYAGGLLHGQVTDYYDDGNTEAVYMYEYGEPTGTWKSFYKDGKENVITEYRAGQEHGRKEFYDPSGKFQLVRFYEQGRLVGYSYFDENSRELPMIPFKNESGKLIAYFDNGKVSREMEYVNGELSGTYKAFYYSGQLENEIGYSSGEYDGNYNEYYPDGTLRTEHTYVSGNLQGIQKDYHRNGKIKEKNNYLNNIKHGDSILYNENGMPVKKQKYVNGNVYQVENL